MLMIAVAFFFARRGRMLAAAIIVPMLFLYAGAVAVSPWEAGTMDALAPRVLTHLLGPLLFLFTPARNR